MPLSNDDRGWIMSGLSGVGTLHGIRFCHIQTTKLMHKFTACIFGASFICIDILVRQFPGKKGWRIQDSDAFLSTSLSLSFGVMVGQANRVSIIPCKLTGHSCFPPSTTCCRRPSHR